MIGGGGAGAYFLFFKNTPSKQVKKDNADEEEEDENGKDGKKSEKKDAPLPNSPQVFIPLESFTVNLQPDGNQQQEYLQAVLNLQVPTDQEAEKVKARIPEVRSRILMLLSSKRASEISTVEGKEKLTKEIMDLIQKPFNGNTETQKLTGVYFTSFIIQ